MPDASGYVVWCPENGEDGPDDGMEVTGVRDHADAAEAWAQSQDWHGADYLIVGGKITPTVHVMGPTGEVQRFEVSGEAVPSYRARQLEGE